MVPPAGLHKIRFSENTISMPVGYLGNTIDLENRDNTYAIEFSFGNHNVKSKQLFKAFNSNLKHAKQTNQMKSHISK